MAVATPMPLSAPSVVPLAFTQSPSTRTSMGSVMKSNSTSEFFSQTMSRWPWMITVGADSWPGVAGTFTVKLPVASLRTSKPFSFAQASTWAEIFSSCLEGRGTRRMPSKWDQTCLGSRLSRGLLIVGLLACVGLSDQFYHKELAPRWIGSRPTSVTPLDPLSCVAGVR